MENKIILKIILRENNELRALLIYEYLEMFHRLYPDHDRKGG